MPTAMSIMNQINVRRFVLQRIEDESGVSGIGIVAEGAEFSDGAVALRWRSHIKSMVVYESIRACAAIHGHNGKTQVVYIDGEQQL
jgi:hypothetical protein